MGIFDLIFKNNKNNVSKIENHEPIIAREHSNNSCQPSVIENPSNTEIKLENNFFSEEITEIDIEFIKKINNANINNINFYNKDVFQQKLGNLEKRIELYRKLELIRDADKMEIICIKYNIPDLKSILKNKGLKVSGNKTELLNRIEDNFSESEINDITRNYNIITLTENGLIKLNENNLKKQNEKELLESDIIDMIINNKILEAVNKIAEYENKQTSKRGIGIDWENDINIEGKEQVEHIMKTNYLNIDLNLDETVKIRIKAIISLGLLFGLSIKDITKKILIVTEDKFHNKIIMDLLKNKPCGGYASRHLPEDDDIAELYVHSIMFEAINEVTLNNLKKDKIGKGIEIMDSGEPCRICTKGNHKFTWTEINSLPKLPRHPGCRCSYLAWI